VINSILRNIMICIYLTKTKILKKGLEKLAIPDIDPIFKKQAAPSLMYVGNAWNGTPHNFDRKGSKRHIKRA
jgi:hypothetical protein